MLRPICLLDDAKHRLPDRRIVTHNVTNQGHDRDLLAKMATQAKEALQREEMHILADKGCFSAFEILACHRASITAVSGALDQGS